MCARTEGSGSMGCQRRHVPVPSMSSAGWPRIVGLVLARGPVLGLCSLSALMCRCVQACESRASHLHLLEGCWRCW